MERDKGFWFSKGQELFRNKDYGTALEAYMRAMELGDSSPAVCYNIALCLFNLRRYKDALALIKEAILRYSSWEKSHLSDSYEMKAKILWMLDENDEAYTACNQALQLNPSNEGARSLMKRITPSPLNPYYLKTIVASLPKPPKMENILNVRCYDGAVKSVVYSPDGKYIASVGDEKIVRVWKALSLDELYSYQYRSGLVNFIGWSPDSKYIILGSSDGTIMVGEALAEKWFLSYKGHNAAVNSAAWSPDGRFIASGSDDKTIQVWEALTGKLVCIYKRHSWAVNSIAYSPDGTYIASGSTDTHVHIWEALIGKKVRIYKGHTGAVNSVAWYVAAIILHQGVVIQLSMFGKLSLVIGFSCVKVTQGK